MSDIELPCLRSPGDGGSRDEWNAAGKAAIITIHFATTPLHFSPAPVAKKPIAANVRLPPSTASDVKLPLP